MTITAFLTDSTLCIGCKACEVACKEWNQLPADGFAWQGLSYDHTVALGHSTWRHVQFVEGNPQPGLGGNSPDLLSWAFLSDAGDGRAFKCTFCYDRQKAGLQPACATACPTESIKFGEIGELRKEAEGRVSELRAKGFDDVHVYDPRDSSVGGVHALFLTRGDPKAYNLPPHPEVPTVRLGRGWKSAGLAAGLMLAGTLLAFLGGGHRSNGHSEGQS